MYLNVLKKDFKREKTMNVLLLLFAILASMFVSSGLSDVVSVLNGTSYFLDKAGVGDYVILVQDQDSGLEEVLNHAQYIQSYTEEKVYWASTQNVKAHGKELDLGNDIIVLQSIDPKAFTYFDLENQVMEKVNPGEVYVSSGVLNTCDLKIGDEIVIDFHGVNLTVKIAGEMKDALLGSDMMGNTRFLFSDEDMAKFHTEETRPYHGSVFHVFTDETSMLKSDLANADKILFDGPKSTVELSYVMELIVAMVVLVMSVCLCIVSFVLMKFVINFSISEDFREIGVMKAIGIPNFKIRVLYMVKYFAMAVVGGFIGFLAGLPFAKFMMESISKKMVLSNDLGIVLNVVGAFLVILVMSGFAFFCTRKVKKLTPVDAIRSGTTGERYGKKRKLSLTRMPTSNAMRLAVNDIFSSPKRFVTIILSFFLCSILVFGIVEVTDTMLSDRLVTTFGKRSDIYMELTNEHGMDLLCEEGNQMMEEMLDGVENDLREMGIPGKATMEVWYKYKLIAGDREYKVHFQQNLKLHADEYEYTEGSAPQNRNEIAITKIIHENLDISIGDTVVIDFGSEQIPCIVVGYFQSMNQLGSIIRLHEDAPTSMEYASTVMGIQIDFDDHPNAKTIESRIQMLKDFYHQDDVFNAAEFCDDCMKVASTMQAVQYLLLAITAIVVIMVTILMERSFIHDETSQIAMLKALGFKDRFIIKWHSYRFLIVAVIAELLAIALTHPVTKLWCDPIWKMMGCEHVDYYFKPLSLLVIYPGIILLINLVTVFLTAQITRKIKCNQVRNIE